jgi:phosphate uptake regulator
MKRKVQQLGSSTLAVTVPAEWARQHDIEKGDEVVVQRDENGGSLLIVPEEPSTADSDAIINVDSLSPAAVERAIVSQYVLGRRLIRLESSSPLTSAQRNAALDAERRLMGLGVVEQADRRITVRCSVAPSDFDLPTLLGRISRTEATMRSDAMAALVEGQPDRAAHLDTRYEQVEKLYYLFLRLVFVTYRNPRLNQAVGLDTGFPLIGYRSVAQDLLLMADLAREIGDLVADGRATGFDPDGETVARFSAVGETLETAVSGTVDAVTTPSYAETEAARERFETVDERLAALYEHLEAERPEPLVGAIRSAVLLERSARHARDSLTVATHLAFRADPDLVSTD